MTEPPSTHFGRWFGMRCLERADGRTLYELDVTDKMTNKRGVAHGGVAASLLDTAMGSAVVSAIAREEWCATTQLSIQYRRPVRLGRVLARGRMIRRGRHAAFAEGEITDEAGEVLAAAHGTWYIWPGRPD